MKLVGWVFIIAVWLILVGYIGFQYMYSPSKDQVGAVKSMAMVLQNYVDNKQNDYSAVEGTDNNKQLVTVYGELLEKSNSYYNSMVSEKRLILALVQPVSLSSQEAITFDRGIASVAEYDAKIVAIQPVFKQAIQEASTKMDAVPREGLMFDVVQMADGVRKSEQQIDSVIELYRGVGQYVKAILEFSKSRIGLYEYNAMERQIIFQSAQDQAYYVQLVTGLNQYVNQIDEQDRVEREGVRKSIDQLTKNLPQQ